MFDHIAPPVIRNIDASELFENFFIFSIVSILGIRLFLRITNYPQLGGNGLHIAHLLWGGLFMTVALMLFFLFLNKAIQQVASVIAGIGFGAFIDELGKFVTADNNYFYRPTFAIIYSIFVVLYLSYRILAKRETYSPVEYLANALEATKEALIHDFDVEERRQALSWLKKADQENEFTQALRELVRQQRPIPVEKSLITSWRMQLLLFYRNLVRKQWVITVGMAFFAVEVISYLALLTLLVIFRNTIRGWFVELNLNFYGWGLLVSLLVTMTLLSIGLVFIRNISRNRAYRFFRYSLLANVLLVTFFVFYFNQIAALINFGINFTLLKAFELASVQEKKLKVYA